MVVFFYSKRWITINFNLLKESNDNECVLSLFIVTIGPIKKVNHVKLIMAKLNYLNVEFIYDVLSTVIQLWGPIKKKKKIAPNDLCDQFTIMFLKLTSLVSVLIIILLL